MNSPPLRTTSEHVAIEGPSGNLEGIADSTMGGVPIVAVLCHPHPQYGGTMTNKVVHWLAKACNDLGVTAVRFNYRGVGASAGTYDDGNGETDDAVAVIDWAQQRWPEALLWLGGFSFGGAIAIKAAARRSARTLITIAPAIRMVAVDTLPQCPWLLVQGDNDELVDATHIQQWVHTLQVPPDLRVLSGADHFFHGRLNDLRELIVKWARERNDLP